MTWMTWMTGSPGWSAHSRTQPPRRSLGLQLGDSSLEAAGQVGSWERHSGGLRKIKWGYKLTQEQAARQEQERAGTEERTSSTSRVQLPMPDKQQFLLFIVREEDADICAEDSCTVHFSSDLHFWHLQILYFCHDFDFLAKTFVYGKPYCGNGQ